ncbi:MAG: hypothetical protein IPH58_09355 [Sphingobacteriales bacterium]|nr:hypothetical protein [Sphingobacteriales bacterium]
MSFDLLRIYFYSLHVRLFRKVFLKNPVRFSHLTVEDGLSNSSVLSISQDYKGFIWLGTRDGLNRYDGKRITIYRDLYKNNPKGPNVKINCIAEDKLRNLWIGTNNGLYIYNPVEDKFSIIIYDYINFIFEDNEGSLWIGTTTGLYFSKAFAPDKHKITFVKYEGKDKQIFQNIQCIVQKPDKQLIIGSTAGFFSLQKKEEAIYATRHSSMRQVNIITMSIDSTGYIWAGSNTDGLYRIDNTFKAVRHYTEGNNAENILSNNVRKVLVDKKGQIWIGTLKGLNRYNYSTDKIDAWVHHPDDPYSINYNSIYDIFEDKQGSVWIGTYYGGANRIDAFSTPFEVYQNASDPNILSSNIISAISSSTPQSLWVGTEAEGLNLLNLENKTVTRFNTGNKKLLSSNLVKTIYRDYSNALWIGFFAGGVNVTKNEGLSFSAFTSKNSRLRSNDITSIIEDNEGRLWIGQQEVGIDIFDKARKTIHKLSEVFPKTNLPKEGITCLFKDLTGNIFIGTRKSVYLMRNNQSDSLKTLENIFPDKNQMTYINCITEDKNQTIWIGSSFGLTNYLPATNKITTYTIDNGLPDNKVVAIVEDENNNLWLSTSKGISKFNLQEKRFANYKKPDGLPGDVFNYNSSYKDRQGRIFFGSYNGLVDFNPITIEINNHPPEITLTKLEINDRQVTVADKSSVLKKNISEIKNIRLSHNQSDVIIDYAVLNFIKPNKNLSAYQLVGYNNEWVYTNEHRAFFRNLEPGNYTLFIKAANNDGLWSQSIKMLQIRVDPPFWLTWWAYTFYFLLVVSVMTAIFRFFNSRKELQRKLHYEHELNLRQQELQNMKTDFFTHMSHELRTPLTLIQGPAEMLVEKSKENTTERKLAQSIQSNSDRLLHLTNNIMDFMKADSGALKLNNTSVDFIKFSKEVFDKFALAAREKKYTILF